MGLSLIYAGLHLRNIELDVEPLDILTWSALFGETQDRMLKTNQQSVLIVEVLSVLDEAGSAHIFMHVWYIPV